MDWELDNTVSVQNFPLLAMEGTSVHVWLFCIRIDCHQNSWFCYQNSVWLDVIKSNICIRLKNLYQVFFKVKTSQLDSFHFKLNFNWINFIIWNFAWENSHLNIHLRHYRYRAFGDPPSERTAEDIAIAVARFFSKKGTMANYYMVKNMAFQALVLNFVPKTK